MGTSYSDNQYKSPQNQHVVVTVADYGIGREHAEGIGEMNSAHVFG
jgi:hypothetical protein